MELAINSINGIKNPDNGYLEIFEYDVHQKNISQCKQTHEWQSLTTALEMPRGQQEVSVQPISLLWHFFSF